MFLFAILTEAECNRKKEKGIKGKGRGGEGRGEGKRKEGRKEGRKGGRRRHSES